VIIKFLCSEILGRAIGKPDISILEVTNPNKSQIQQHHQIKHRQRNH